VVLTGGACQLPGVREMAARMLSRQVRLGRPGTLRGLPELASGPAFSTAAGLLSWAAGDGRGFQDINLDGEPPTGLFRRFVNFLKERV
jgi:cell division protein FtsA